MVMNAILKIEDLKVQFHTRKGTATVINRLNLSLYRGETLGIVGESGCGKSITALSIMGLVPCPPGEVANGTIVFDGRNLLELNDKEMRKIRGNKISMIFQEPMTSLNPVFPVGDQISEVLRLHQGMNRRDARDRSIEMLKAVGIPSPEKRVREFPHQMSGGMRQRVMIAIALACQPSLLIADEPTTALDVTVQAQIFDLMNTIKQEMDTGILFITHNMGAIARMSDRVAVMYAGYKVEEGSVGEILQTPKHPYTVGLISCVPHLEPDPPEERRPLTEIEGMVPSLFDRATGCPFAQRCAHVQTRCRETMPPAVDLGRGHEVACWLLS